MVGLSRRALIQLTAASSLVLGRQAGAAPVEESGFVRIGGIDQWVAMRGSDSANPAILYLHGGPAEAQSPFLNQFLPWEQDFTVINWDQRGAGKTFGRNGSSTPEMTLDRLVDDAIEVAEHFCSRLSLRKIILVGQSWGSFLGINVIKRRPDLFHAFVGTGQFVSIAAHRPYQIAGARQQAIAEGDQDTLKALDDVAGLSPEDRAVARAVNKWVISSADLEYATMVRAFMAAAPEAPNKGDVDAWLGGVKLTEEKLIPALRGMDLRKLGLDIPIPFFAIHGRDDHITPFEPARDYVADIRAPKKAFVLIDGGHYACFTQAAQFVAALRAHVRLLVT